MCLELFSRVNWWQALVQCRRMLRLKNPSHWSCRVLHPVKLQLLNSWGRRHREKSPQTAGEEMLSLFTDNLSGVTKAGINTVKLAVRWQHNTTKGESHPGDSWCGLTVVEHWSANDSKKGWGFLSKLRPVPVLPSAAPTHHCIYIIAVSSRNVGRGISPKPCSDHPRRDSCLPFVFRNGGTPTQNRNVSWSLEQKLNQNLHVYSWQIVELKTISHRTTRTSRLILST